MAKIIGNTTATPNPRPDWNQTDETKADFIKNKPVIFQDTGDSETGVMSQKAATDAIASAVAESAKGISKNAERIDATEKRLTNLEQAITPSPFVTDDAVAYGKTVPENVLPYASINRIGGILKKSHNLLNVADATAQAYERVTIDGDVIKIAPASSLYGIQFLNASEIFEVGKTYYFTASPSQSYGGTGFRFIYTDKSTSAIRQSGVLTVEKEISTLVYYISWGTGFDTETTISNIQAVEGDVDLPYEPYWEGVREAKVTAIKSVGVNLFDPQKIIDAGGTENNGEYTVDTSDLYRVWNGKDLSSVPCKKGTRYIVGFEGRNDNTADRAATIIFTIVYADGSQSTMAFVKTNEWCYEYAVSTAGKDVLRIGVTYSYSGVSYLRNVFISEYTGDNAYTPYVKRTLPIPETVQALHGYGWGVSESANNYIDFEKKQFVQSVEKIDLGSLTWSKEVYGAVGSYHTWFQTPIENIKPIYEGESATLLCEKHDARPYYSLYYGGDCGIAVDSQGNLAVLDSAYSDVTSFKEAMNGVFAYIELAEPIITDISDLLSPDNFIEVEGGGVIAFENEYKMSVPNNIAYVMRKE